MSFSGSFESGQMNAQPEAKRAGIKILQCNNEYCQYERRNNGNIEWASQSNRLVNLNFDSKPQLVLIIKKPNAPPLSLALKEVAHFLRDEKNLQVAVEPAVKAEFPDLPWLISLGPPGCTANQYCPDTLRSIDFVICLGGDGTIMWVNGLYNGPCPPIVSFAMGSLGFLTPFDFSDYKKVITRVMRNEMKVEIRTRLWCTVHNDMRRKIADFITLNEVSVDRGPSPYLTNIECFCDDRFVCASQGDGIIVATPTGSTAYSLAAGGSMVHPDVPGMLLTPICASVLSFRPIVFPDSVTLRLQVPVDSSVSAWCSFDGRNAMSLSKGWSVTVITSKWPLPLVARSGGEDDWFNGVMETLNWNNRKVQGGFARTCSGDSIPGEKSKN